MIMNVIYILLGKAIILAMRLFGKNGSALPGLIVEKLYPRLLENQLAKLSEGVVVITGTNGKTTTTKSTSFLIEQCGRRVLTNQTGSNLTRGIYSTIIKASSWTGEMPYDVAVLELDEAYSRVFARRFKPRFVLALNVMRDQLDRYGEINTTAQMIGDAVALATEGVVLNADDPRVRDLSSRASAKVHYFGVSKELRADLPSDDELLVVSNKKHKKKTKQRKDHLMVELKEFKPNHAAFGIAHKTYHSRVQVHGLHNAFNMTAALSMALLVCPDMEPQFLVPTVEGIRSAFGRGETLEIDGKSITLSLVKNPSGFVQSLRSYSHETFDTTLIAINDDYADGRDVSWLWDVDVSYLQSVPTITTTGSRAEDMALRLDYEDIKTEHIDSDLESALEHTLTSNASTVIIYCTYTAMLQIRKMLASKTTVEEIWRKN